MATPASVAGAYASMARNLGKAATGASDGAAKSTNFTDLLGQALDGVAQTGAQADAKAQAAVAGGKTDVIDIVTAVADSEAAISTLVSVRDRVIAAYQQIMSMPI
jgi:flagellar hook-basal body complex protein FliE